MYTVRWGPVPPVPPPPVSPALLSRVVQGGMSQQVSCCRRRHRFFFRRPGSRERHDVTKMPQLVRHYCRRRAGAGDEQWRFVRWAGRVTVWLTVKWPRLEGAISLQEG